MICDLLAGVEVPVGRDVLEGQPEEGGGRHRQYQDLQPHIGFVEIGN